MRYEQRGKSEYWAFEAIVDDVKIRVIVEAIDKKEKHFLSVIKKGTVKKEIKKRQ